MDRRTFLKSSGAATVGGLATANVAAATEDARQTSPARSLSIATSPSVANESTALIVRNLSEAVETGTEASLQLIGTHDAATSDMTLTSIMDRVDDHAAWATFLPIINGFDHATFAGWMATGGGSTIVDQLEAETQQRILFVGTRPTPYGIWADRELFGLHPRPSLTVVSGERTVLHHEEAGSGGLTCMLSDGLVADLEGNQLHDCVLHALPTLLAGEPLVLTMSWSTWETLNNTERTLLAALAEASFAGSVSQNDVATRMATTAMPLPTPIPLPEEFQLALTAALEAERGKLAAISDLAADSLASQAAFRAVTRAGDLTRVRNPLAS